VFSDSQNSREDIQWRSIPEIFGAEEMATDDFFRARLDGMVDPRHPLVVLASRIPWPQIEDTLAPALAHKDRKGRIVEGADMFGPMLSVAGADVSAAGRPRLPIRGTMFFCSESHRVYRTRKRYMPAESG